MAAEPGQRTSTNQATTQQRQKQHQQKQQQRQQQNDQKRINLAQYTNAADRIRTIMRIAEGKRQEDNNSARKVFGCT